MRKNRSKPPLVKGVVTTFDLEGFLDLPPDNRGVSLGIAKTSVAPLGAFLQAPQGLQEAIYG